MFIDRNGSLTVQRYLSTFPVVGLTGPRQSGKSTLLQNELPNYHYLTFDDLANIEHFEQDPQGFINRYNEHVIFDEVQFVPDIFKYIKLVVDQNRQDYGRFVLTGSNQFSHLQHASESLAGRVGLMSLLPFQYNETPKALRSEAVFRGGYPELVTRDYRESELWFSSYIETYLNKDVRVLSNIGDMRDFRRLIQLLAANTSQQLDLTNYAKELGVSVPTIKRWISILEASYIIFLLPPFYNNFGKRIIKSPKIYFYDTGLVSYLTGVKTYKLYDDGPLAGALFENYIISEIAKSNLHLATGAELYYLKTSDGAEIDLIIDRKTEQDLVEIKKSASFSSKYINTLKKYTSETRKGILIYKGKSDKYSDDIRMLNYSDYLTETS